MKWVELAKYFASVFSHDFSPHSRGAYYTSVHIIIKVLR